MRNLESHQAARLLSLIISPAVLQIYKITTRKLTTLTLKHKIELIDEVEKKTKKEKDVAAEFDVPANTVSAIMKKKDHYRDLYLIPHLRLCWNCF